MRCGADVVRLRGLAQTFGAADSLRSAAPAMTAGQYFARDIEVPYRTQSQIGFSPRFAALTPRTPAQCSRGDAEPYTRFAQRRLLDSAGQAACARATNSRLRRVSLSQSSCVVSMERPSQQAGHHLGEGILSNSILASLAKIVLLKSSAGCLPGCLTPLVEIGSDFRSASRRRLGRVSYSPRPF
jgi:hypothetical protein